MGLFSAAHTVSLQFAFGDEHRARVVADAIRIEVDEVEDDRAGATVSRVGDSLTVEIRAEDLHAFRAGINSWMRLVRVAETASSSALDMTN